MLVSLCFLCHSEKMRYKLIHIDIMAEKKRNEKRKSKINVLFIRVECFTNRKTQEKSPKI